MLCDLFYMVNNAIYISGEQEETANDKMEKILSMEAISSSGWLMFECMFITLYNSIGHLLGLDFSPNPSISDSALSDDAPGDGWGFVD